MRATCKLFFTESRLDALWRFFCFRDIFTASPARAAGMEKVAFRIPEKVLQREHNSHGAAAALQLLPTVHHQKFGKSWEWVYTIYATPQPRLGLATAAGLGTLLARRSREERPSIASARGTGAGKAQGKDEKTVPPEDGIPTLRREGP